MRSRPPAWQALGLVPLRPVVASAAHDQPENEMRVDADVICPRCLRFVWPHEYVRRNALGLVQHQVCPDDGDDAA